MARALLASTWLAMRRPMESGKPVVKQRIEIILSDDIDVATVATVPPIGTAFRNIFFTAKADSAIAAITGFNANEDFIDKFHAGS